MKTIAITGASGFIGVHLVRALLRAGGYRIRILSRSSQAEARQAAFPADVEIFSGDINDPVSLARFLAPGCTVINLVYLRNESEQRNLVAIGNLLAACKAGGITRLIHCSTADVAGRTPDRRVVESSPCRPRSAYATTKLKIEAAILAVDQDSHEVAILRPTAVFGPGGQNLKKLAHAMVHGNRLTNDLRACVFGRRHMNLVHVDNVVAAIMFLADRVNALSKEVFIVSDDDAVSNNFASVERALMNGFGLQSSRLPRVLLPSWLLSLTLRLLGRSNVNPLCIYDSGKLRSIGFERPVPFDDGLSRYIAWYRSDCLEQP